MYTFSSIRSSYVIDIRWTVSGSAVSRMHELVDPYFGTNPAPPSGISEEIQALTRAYFAPRLLDASGQPVALGGWGYTYGPRHSAGPAEGQLSAILPGPGRYTIQFGAVEGGAQRIIAVPSSLTTRPAREQFRSTMRSVPPAIGFACGRGAFKPSASSSVGGIRTSIEVSTANFVREKSRPYRL